MESKCLSNCLRKSADGKCHGHTIDELLQCLDTHANTLSQLRHKNIVNYECIYYQKKKEGVVLYIVQDFVLGTRVGSITGSLGWCVEGVSMVARSVLDSLIYLHNQGVSHNNLTDYTVFMDNSGTVRITDYSLIPMVLELIGNGDESDSRDLPALGSLIETMSPTMLHADLTEFVDRCKSGRIISASELLEHPFLRAVGQVPNSTTAIQTRTIDGFERRQSVQVRILDPHVDAALSSAMAHSRLSTEFEALQWLGKGAFGDVLKVRNLLDNREYAIKRIPLTPKTRIYLERKMTREVELLSRLNHENVVRYYNSWLESASLADNIGGDDEDEDDSSSNEQSSVKPKIPRIMPADESSSSSEGHWMA